MPDPNKPDGLPYITRDGQVNPEIRVYNLAAWFRLADLADRSGVDLWHYQTSDGRSLRKGLDFLVPYAEGTQTWTYKQITRFDPGDLTPLLYRAAPKYNEERYHRLAVKLDANAAQNRLNLVLRTLGDGPPPAPDSQ
jgi:hypothetical protein